MTPWSAVHQTPLSMGILQARILEWVAMPGSRGSSQPRDQTWVSGIVGRFFTIWASRVALIFLNYVHPAFSTRASKQKQTEYVCQESRWQLLWVSALLPIKWESRRYRKSFPTLKKYLFSFCCPSVFTPISERLTASSFDTNCLYDCPLRLFFCLLIL